MKKSHVDLTESSDVTNIEAFLQSGRQIGTLSEIRELTVSCSQLHAHTRPNATHTSRVFAGSALGTLLPATTVSEGFVSVFSPLIGGPHLGPGLPVLG